MRESVESVQDITRCSAQSTSRMTGAVAPRLRGANMKTPLPGIYHGVSFEDYLAWGAVSNSSLSPATKSMLHYYHQRRQVETPAMRLGHIVHAGKLEPATLLKDYAIMPNFIPLLSKEYLKPRASKEYKALVSAWRVDYEGKNIVTQDEFNKLKGILVSLAANPVASEYLGRGEAEVSIVWEDRDSGVLCKGRADWWDEDANAITDLKTTKDCGEFERAIVRFHYHRQGAFYVDGMQTLTGKQHNFRIVAVETTEPYGVRAAPMSPEALEVGREEYKKLLCDVAKCRTLGLWPGYKNPDEWALPEWMMPETEIKLNGKDITA